MAPQSLVSLPTELITNVLQNCDTFKDVIATATTCRRIHDVFEGQLPRIAWGVGHRDLYAFDVALIAVRATRIVCDSLRANKLPPVERLLPIKHLGGTKRLPSREEFQETLKLQHFGRCVEHLIFLNAPRYNLRIFEPYETILQAAVGWPRNDPLFPKAHKLWKERLYRSIFRLLVCGAVLSSAYHEPFFHDDPGKPFDFLNRYVGSLLPSFRPRHAFMMTSRDPTISDGDLRFLQQFPAYRITDYAGPFDKDETAMFQPLADWLLEDMKLASEEEGNTLWKYGERLNQWPIHSQCLQSIWTFEQLNTIIIPPTGTRGCGRLPIAPLIERRPSSDGTTGETKTITIILHGIYQPEEITMPVTPGDEISAGGISTRYHLISKAKTKSRSKQMSLPGMGLRRPKQIQLCELLRRVAYVLPNPVSMSVWSSTLPEHRLFNYMLQEQGLGVAEARSVIWGTSSRWHAIVSILAFRHKLENSFENLIAAHIPKGQWVDGCCQPPATLAAHPAQSTTESRVTSEQRFPWALLSP